MFQCFFFLNPFAKKCRSVIKSLFNGTGHEHLLLVVFYFSCVFYNETAATVFVPNRCMRLGFLYIFFLLFSVVARIRFWRICVSAEVDQRATATLACVVVMVVMVVGQMACG